MPANSRWDLIRGLKGQWPWQTLTTALCTLTFVDAEKTVILQVLNDLRCGHQFRQISWNYPLRDFFQEEKAQMYHTPL